MGFHMNPFHKCTQQVFPPASQHSLRPSRGKPAFHSQCQECARFNLSGMPPVYTPVAAPCFSRGGALALRNYAALSQRASALGTNSGDFAATVRA